MNINEIIFFKIKKKIKKMIDHNRLLNKGYDLVWGTF